MEFHMPEGIVNNAAGPALPPEIVQMNYLKNFDGSLHPKRPSNSVRREMTERRISQNIKQFNSAVATNDISDLYVGSSIHGQAELSMKSYQSFNFVAGPSNKMNESSEASFETYQNLGGRSQHDWSEEKKMNSRSGSFDIM